MMKLLVDMGNSAMKWATISGSELSQVKLSGYDEPVQHLKSIWQSLSTPESITISCVTHEQQWQQLSQLGYELWGITARRIASADKGYGIINAYPQPANLGSDRWAALVAAHAIYQKDVCIVDCGTALTVDLLSGNGQHLGGVIVPGAKMMQNSLHLNTAAISRSIPQMQENEKQEYWGRDTQSGIIKGSWQALAGTVAQVYGQFAKHANEPVCILCGGDANQVAKYLDIEVAFEPDLVLKGLAIIAGDNITT